jgi:hypothetical protein
MSTTKRLTGMSADVRQIARLLQAKAPPGHKLAYINDEEAALLKRRGGSGRITEAGIPSYENDGDFVIDVGRNSLDGSNVQQPTFGPSVNQSFPDLFGTSGPTPKDQSPVATTETPAASVSDNTASTGTSSALNIPSIPQGVNPIVGPMAAGQGTSAATVPQFGPTGLPTTQLPNIPSGFQPGADISATTAPPKPSTWDEITKKLSQPQSLAALGIGGAQSLLGAYQVKKAAADAQQAKEQTQALATPYQTQGQQLQQFAQQGQLTPANQQILQAAQAQLAQGASARGGVGAAQATTQLANIQAGLLQNQMNLGLQVQAIGDKIAQGAIQAGVQADQYINTLTSNYAMNIGRVLASASGIPQQTTTTVTTGVNP